MPKFNFIEFKVPPHLDGQRLDKVLMEKISRRQGRKLISDGAVFINNKRVKIASKRVKQGQTIKFAIQHTKIIKEINWQKTIVFENEHIIAINKPNGVPSGPTPLGDKGTASYELSKLLGQKLIVSHRIDNDTSGLLIFAKSKKGAQSLSAAFKEKRIKKFYKAIIRGIPTQTDLRFPLKKTSNGLMKIAKHGMSAHTKILEIQELFDDYKLLLIELLTGRTHQIRVHLSHIGCPIVGDRWYGTGGYPLLLHSWKVTLRDELLGNHEWIAELPPHWDKFLNALNQKL